jgi:MYXO-CTERM domain-containing protein
MDEQSFAPTTGKRPTKYILLGAIPIAIASVLTYGFLNEAEEQQGPGLARRLSNHGAKKQSPEIKLSPTVKTAGQEQRQERLSKKLTLEEKMQRLLKARQQTKSDTLKTLPSLDDQGKWSFSGKNGQAKYHANFDQDGLNFEVENGHSKKAHLRYKFHSLAIGQRELELSKAYPRANVDGDSIEFDHGHGIVERYTNVQGGIEQFFILHEKLSNDEGDLILLASLDSSATKKRPVKASPSGLKFFDQNSSVMMSLSELIIFDHAGRTTRGTMSLHNGTLAYRVSSKWLAEADYPVTIDPIVQGLNLTVATVPFLEEFEAPLGTFWGVLSTGTGRAVISTTDAPFKGSSHFAMDSSVQGTFSRNELILAVDLTGQTSSTLFFQHKETGDEDDPLPTTFAGALDGDGVSISEDGNTWFRAVDLSGANISSIYQLQSADLGAIATANGLTLNGAFFIKFQQFDNFDIPSDGFFFDDVIVTKGPAASAVVWDPTPSPDFGTVAVGQSVSATFVLRNIGPNAATGTVSLASPDFAITAGAGAYSLAVGATLNVTASFTPATAGSKTGSLIATSNNGQGDVVNPLTGLGLQIIPGELPFFDGFECATLGPAYKTATTVSGRIQITSNSAPRTGTGHLALDSSVDGNFSRNEVILTLNLAGQTTANLSFFMKTTGDEAHVLPTTFTGSADGDGVSISADGTNWFRVVDLSAAPPTAYTQFTVDLVTAAANAGIAFNGNFQIKFQQFDNFMTPLDGFFFDDVSVDNGNTAANVILDPTPDGVFGTIPIGNTPSQTFVVRNTGNAPASGDISLPAGAFAITSGGGPYTIAAGDCVEAVVQFAPTTANTFNETFTATVTGQASLTKALSGTGIVPPNISFDAAPDGNFGDVTVGNNTNLTFVLRNTGGSNATGTISVTSTVYTITSGGGTYTLAPAATRMVTVQFTPAQLGPRGDILTATATGFASATKNLIGVGTTPPAILSWAVTPTGDFGTVGIGSNSDKTFVLQNTGTVPATGTLTVSNPNYSIVSGGGNYTVSAGATRNVVVRFAPTQSGAIAANLSASLLNNVDTVNPLTGVGQANPALLWDANPGGDFGSVAAGVSRNLSFVLRNNGNTSITGTITVSNPVFTLSGGGGAYTLASGATRTVVVNFAPTAAGPQNASLIASIGAVPGASKNITGSGINATAVAFDVSPDGNYGGVVIGGNASRNFILRNAAPAAVSGTVTVDNMPAYQIIQGGGNFSLAPGSSTSVVVRFSASAAPAQTATLTATVNNATNSTKALSASGQAQVAAKVPFSEGFESGSLRAFWQTNSTNEGRIQITEAMGPNLGKRHLVMDDVTTNTVQSLNELILTVDLSNSPNANLTFHHKEFSDADQPLPNTFQNSFNGDGVAISEDGTTWFNLANLTTVFSQPTYNQITLDVSQAAAFFAITLNNNFKIKFQQFESGTAPLDGFAFDDIAITDGAPVNVLTLTDNFGNSTPQILTARGKQAAVMNFQAAASFFEDLRIDSMTFTSSGSGHEVFDITACRLVRDNDSNGAFDPIIDTQLGFTTVFVADEGTITFTNVNQVIPAGTMVNLLLVWDFSPTASFPSTFTPRIALNTDVTVLGVPSGSAATVTPAPFTGPVVNVQDFIFNSIQRPSGGGGCQVSTGDSPGPQSLLLLLLALFSLSAIRRARG